MGTVLKIVILEDNRDEAIELKNFAHREPDLEVVAVTGSEEEALKEVKSHLPHVIILDLELEQGSGDGISFLRKVRKMELPVKPFVIVTTYTRSTVIKDMIHELGADYIFYKLQKDYSSEGVIKNIKDMQEYLLTRNTKQQAAAAEETEDKSPAVLSQRRFQRLNAELDLIDMSHKLSGRRYIMETVALILEMDYSDKDAMTIIADKKGMTYMALFQAINNAIAKTWSKTAPDKLFEHFTGYIDPEKGSPTVSEFIYYYADKVRYSI